MESKQESSKILKIQDILVSKIIYSEDNPNEQDERTFDKLVESIKEDGFDEPIIVVPSKNKYKIVSGAHRYKAALTLKYTKVPCVVHTDWDDDKRKIELVRRNILRGNLNPEKFTLLYKSLTKKYDEGILKSLMGFTKNDAFNAVYKNVSNSVSKKQKKKLDEAKERINSVDDLSSILNTIFKEHGSELDQGFLVFSFGGKNHHYVPITAQTDKKLISLEKELENSNLTAQDVFAYLISNVDLSKIKPSSNKKEVTKPKIKLKRKQKPND